MGESAPKIAIRAAGAKALAEYLQEEISTGRIGEGVKLPAERELSERFDASRGAVRRVLQAFRDRGLITQVMGSGTFVSPGAVAILTTCAVPAAARTLQISPAELMEARLLIEPLMPRLIVRNATPSDLARMSECLDESEAASSIEEFEHWDGELHRALALATHNAFFVQVLELSNAVREQGEWGRLKRHSLTPERRAQYQVQHRAIVDALRDRDADTALDALAGHLRQIQAKLFAS